MVPQPFMLKRHDLEYRLNCAPILPSSRRTSATSPISSIHALNASIARRRCRSWSTGLVAALLRWAIMASRAELLVGVKISGPRALRRPVCRRLD
jgi:hypothetical protein